MGNYAENALVLKFLCFKLRICQEWVSIDFKPGDSPHICRYEDQSRTAAISDCCTSCPLWQQDRVTLARHIRQQKIPTTHFHISSLHSYQYVLQMTLCSLSNLHFEMCLWHHQIYRVLVERKTIKNKHIPRDTVRIAS